MKKILLIISVLLILIIATLYALNPKEIYKLTEKTAKYMPFQQVPSGVVSLKAKDCGNCHVEIYKEWQTSLHSKAFIDPFFKAYLKKDKDDPTCSVCHTPLENQSPIILSSESGHYDDLKTSANPNYNAELQKEGVTCAACHVKDGVIYGPYQADQLNSPHPVAFNENFLKKDLCNQCHEVPSKDFSLMKEGLCSTGQESNSGIWAEKGYICQDCHMPEVTRPLMDGFPARKGKKHLWPGGYSSHQLQKVFTFKAVEKDSKLKISITNSGAGHKAPTGDTDRFIILDFYWKNQQGKTIKLESITFKRQVVWQPIMFVLSDNRLSPGESTHMQVEIPEEKGGLFVSATYHVMSDYSLKKLKDNYGLENEWAIKRPFIEMQKIELL
ncbi:MAG: hypothetical protein ISR69_09145 [Gammaproteobacteria bacterium]|nr:hypothetical protein [Gammaproteobacteria bacterium]